jgi:phage gp29-like protein
MKKATLTHDVAGPTLSGVRSPITGSPADGLNPVRLANILREADYGDPLRFLELAEVIEERDPHYQGVLGTRRRSVTQLEISIEPASDRGSDVKIAEELETWLARGELADELFDVLDSIGKGYSFTEIIWDTSMSQYMPARLERRDQRWFRFDQQSLTRPQLIGPDGEDEPLTAFKFIDSRIRAKSGIPTRSGLARVVLWPFLFKKFTERDWSIFCQTFGQPLRLGTFPSGSTEDERNILFRAVSNIAGDCAAIIPQGMEIEFIQAGNVGSSVDLYERRGDWYDKQVSKAVLGQTATTDAETGGFGSGKEHRQVQEDIETADATALAAVLTRDLVMPYVQLNHGPQKAYPRIKIGRPEEEDLKLFSVAIAPMIDRGLPVGIDQVLNKFGLKMPDKEAEILVPAGRKQNPPSETGENGPESEFEYRLNGRKGKSRPVAPERQSEASAALSAASPDPLSQNVDQLTQNAAPGMEDMLSQIEVMLEAAGSLDELKAMLLEAWPKLGNDQLAAAVAQAMTANFLGGMALVEAEGDD